MPRSVAFQAAQGMKSHLSERAFYKMVYSAGKNSGIQKAKQQLKTLAEATLNADDRAASMTKAFERVQANFSESLRLNAALQADLDHAKTMAKVDAQHFQNTLALAGATEVDHDVSDLPVTPREPFSDEDCEVTVRCLSFD